MDGCIEWTQHRTRKGYGYGWDRVTRTKRQAHRMAYERANGPIPPGMFVCHRCDNPPCINPEHLFLGTNAENIRDCIAKGRIARGARNASTRLLPVDVWAIRDGLAEGRSKAELARAHGVTFMTITAIERGVTWGWLTSRS